MTPQNTIMCVAIGLLLVMAITFTILYILKRQERTSTLTSESITCPTYMCEDDNPSTDHKKQAWRQGATVAPADVIVQPNTILATGYRPK